MKTKILDTMIATQAAAGVAMTKAEAERTYALVIGAVKKVIRTDHEARIPELGTFKFVRKPGRNGRNPATGATIAIPPKDVVTFKMTKAALEA